MIKVIITGIVTVIAGVVGYFLSPAFRERQAQRQRDKIAAEVAQGDEAAVNARIGRFRSVVPWVVVMLLIIGGCAVTRTVYVKEQDKVTALRPGAIYSWNPVRESGGRSGRHGGRPSRKTCTGRAGFRPCRGGRSRNAGDG